MSSYPPSSQPPPGPSANRKNRPTRNTPSDLSLSLSNRFRHASDISASTLRAKLHFPPRLIETRATHSEKCTYRPVRAVVGRRGGQFTSQRVDGIARPVRRTCRTYFPDFQRAPTWAAVQRAIHHAEPILYFTSDVLSPSSGRLFFATSEISARNTFCVATVSF